MFKIEAEMLQKDFGGEILETEKYCALLVNGIEYLSYYKALVSLFGKNS